MAVVEVVMEEEVAAVVSREMVCEGIVLSFVVQASVDLENDILCMFIAKNETARYME